MPGAVTRSPLRESNRARIVNVLRVDGPSSRGSLLKTGLSRSTVALAVDALLREGVLVEVEQPRGSHSTGRPPVHVGLNGARAAAAGVEICHGHMRFQLCNLAQDRMADRIVEIDPSTPPGDTLRVIREQVHDLLDGAGYAIESLLGVGITLPGPIQRRSGVVGRACTLKPWIGVPAATLAASVIGPRVLVDNDANLAALAEVTWGAARAAEDVAYVYTAAGIGVGLVLDGHIYAGSNGTAGELGHTTIDENGLICECGGRGCLNTVANAEAISTQLARTLGQRLPVHQVIALAEEGDVACRRALADAGRHIGTALANLYNLLDPELIVLGGNLARAGQLILEPLRESMARRAIHAGEAVPPVIVGSLHDEVAALGAAAGVLRDGDRFPLVVTDTS